MKKSACIFLFILSTFYPAYAQTVTGRVMDENGKPLTAATVIQLMPQDSSMIDATLTDSLGVYKLSSSHGVNSIIKISFFGYEDSFFDYKQNDLSATQNLKDVSLTPKSFLLNEVIIKGNSPQLSRKADHFSFSVANTDLVKGKNTWDILKFTPFLKVDNLYGIEMIGKGQVTVYINGRKTRLTGSSLKSFLESLPAEDIVNIEIMTNKNSSFRAEDTSGAINIILKKNELEGFKGTVTFRDRQSDYNNFWDGSTYLNYKKGKVDLTTNVFINTYNNRQSNTVNYKYREEDVATNSQDVIKRDDISYGLLFNMDYTPVDNHILGVMVNATKKENKQNGLNFNYYQPINQTRIDSISKSDRSDHSDSYQINTNVNYYIKLNDKRDFISFDFDFLRYNNKHRRITNTDLLDPTETFVNMLDDREQRQKQNITNVAGKIDYQWNFDKKSRLKVGTEVYTTYSDADELFYTPVLVNGNAENLTDSRFLYKETVSAAYGSYSKEWEKISIMIGLRLEHTYGKGEVEEDRSKDFMRKNWNLFPSAAVSYGPNDSHNLSFSFSSGIRRPEFTLLNPFRVYTSETSYRENNPFLKNMKTYTMNFTYTLKSNYIAQVSHFASRHAWSLFKIPIENTNITKELFCNYGNLAMTNVSLIWNKSFFKEFLHINYSLGGYYSHSKGNVESTKIDVAGYVPYLYLSNSIRLSQKQGVRMMISYNFMGEEKMANVMRSPTHNLNMNIQKRFGRLDISLGISDILNLKVKEFYKIDNYDYESVMRFNRRNAWISATYNFGNQKVKGARNRRTNTEVNRRIN